MVGYLSHASVLFRLGIYYPYFQLEEYIVISLFGHTFAVFVFVS
jgi:hypothetical protein